MNLQLVVQLAFERGGALTPTRDANSQPNSAFESLGKRLSAGAENQYELRLLFVEKRSFKMTNISPTFRFLGVISKLNLF